jgi:hypothetical protein
MPDYDGNGKLNLRIRQATESLAQRIDNARFYYSLDGTSARMVLTNAIYRIDYGTHDRAMLNHELAIFAYEAPIGGSRERIVFDVPLAYAPLYSVIYGSGPKSLPDAGTDFAPILDAVGTSPDANTWFRLGTYNRTTVTGEPGNTDRLPFGLIDAALDLDVRHDFLELERPVIFLDADAVVQIRRYVRSLFWTNILKGISVKLGDELLFDSTGNPRVTASTSLVTSSLLTTLQLRFDRLGIPVRVTDQRAIYDAAKNRVKIGFGAIRCSFAQCENEPKGGQYGREIGELLKDAILPDQFNEERLADRIDIFRTSPDANMYNTLIHEVLHAFGAFHIISDQSDEIMVKGVDYNAEGTVADAPEPVERFDGAFQNPMFHALAYGVGVTERELKAKGLEPGNADLNVRLTVSKKAQTVSLVLNLNESLDRLLVGYDMSETSDIDEPLGAMLTYVPIADSIEQGRVETTVDTLGQKIFLVGMTDAESAVIDVYFSASGPMDPDSGFEGLDLQGQPINGDLYRFNENGPDERLGSATIIPDDDNDGYDNTVDAFPFDPTEWLDTDGDGIGNNADSDDDNDGIPDGNDSDPLDPGVPGFCWECLPNRGGWRAVLPLL